MRWGRMGEHWGHDNLDSGRRTRAGHIAAAAAEVVHWDRHSRRIGRTVPAHHFKIQISLDTFGGRKG